MGTKRANKIKSKKLDAEKPLSTVEKLKEGLTDKQLIKAGKVAKTHKGRKILENREGKEFEDPKQAVFLKGNHCNQVTKDAMKSIY